MIICNCNDVIVTQSLQKALIVFKSLSVLLLLRGAGGFVSLQSLSKLSVGGKTLLLT